MPNPQVRAGSTHTTGLICRLTDENAKPIGTALRLIAQSDGAVLLFSSGGKDRVGVVTALALALCDVPAEAIAADYALSQGLKHMLYAAEVADTEERVLRRMRDDRAELCSTASAMLAFLQAFTQRHGSIASWLEKHAAFGPDEVLQLRERMMQPTTA